MLDIMAQQLAEAFPDDQAELDGDGYKFVATVVSASFEGANTLARHKRVYAALDTYIKSGELHALTIRAYTPEEWSTRPAD